MDDKGYFMMKLDHAAGGVLRAAYHSCIVDEKGEVCDMDGNKISCSGGDDDGGDSGAPDPMISFEGRTAKDFTVNIFERWERARELVSVGHASYIGREAQRAEECLAGSFYQQD